MKNIIHKSKKVLYDWEKESLFDSQEDFSSIPNNKNYVKNTNFYLNMNIRILTLKFLFQKIMMIYIIYINIYL